MGHSAQIEIKYVHISQSTEWEQNPRLISDEQLHALAETVRKCGVVDPVIVDESLRIVGGHRRLKVRRVEFDSHSPARRQVTMRKAAAFSNF